MRIKSTTSNDESVMIRSIIKRTAKFKQSRGERLCEKYFLARSIPYQSEYNISSLPNNRYDFMFISQSKKFLLEYDGIQHFKEIKFFHKNRYTFDKKRQIDIIKTRCELFEGYKIIRIDYTQIHNIEHHLNTAIRNGNNLYFSSPSMYSYINSEL